MLRCLLALALPLIAACDGPAPTAASPALMPADTAAGRLAFASSCASCHASGDGYDLAHFGYPDSAIVRRGAPHVGQRTARDVAAYIRTLEARPVARFSRPFQPAGRLASSDRDFAIGLFGADAWPEGLTPEALRAIDPVDVAVAPPLPVWSDESGNFDWVPESPLPEALLDHLGGAPRAALARYYAERSPAALEAAIDALQEASKSAGGPAAPCAPMGIHPARPAACFEVQRWISSLAGQHVLRDPGVGNLEPLLGRTWWVTGDAARANEAELPRARENAAAWLYLGWAYRRPPVASDYLGNALFRLDLPRHATFVAMRSMMERKPGHYAAYSDLGHAARYAPPEWAPAVVGFGLRHLRDLARAGYGAKGSEIDDAIQDLDRARSFAADKVSPEDLAALDGLRAELLVAIGAPTWSLTPAAAREPTARQSRQYRRLLRQSARD